MTASTLIWYEGLTEWISISTIEEDLLAESKPKVTGFLHCDPIRPGYSFNERSQETVPEAIIAFLDSTSFEDSIRLAISPGGDADTLACITGGIAGAFYRKIPDFMIAKAREVLDPSLLQITDEFCERFSVER